MPTQTAALAAAPEASEEEYEALLAALSASERGRAFLREHARRARHADTEILLAALQRLENQVAAQAAVQAPAPAPVHPEVAELCTLLETVRAARAQIDAVQLSAAVTQLVAVLENVQHRLSALLPAAPALATECKSSPPVEVQPPFALALTAVAAQALAAAEREEEPIKVIKAGSIPPPPPFAGEDFSGAEAEADEQSERSASLSSQLGPAHEDLASPNDMTAASPHSDEDPLAPLMRLTEEERLALFC